MHHADTELTLLQHPETSQRGVLYCIALEQAIWVLWLQGLLVLHRAEPPGVIDDAAEPHAWGTKLKGGSGTR